MSLVVKHLGLQDYLSTWQAMQTFTENRTEHSADEIWFVEHPAVFTQGLNGKAEHLLQTTNIPIVQTDRGGQITYHAPGQLIMYVLLDLKRAKLGIRQLVHDLEKIIIQLLAQHQIESQAREDAPGVYVEGQKIASLGLKVKKHKTYHGIALNVDMDLSPFQQINPCGLQGMQMTQVSHYQPNLTVAQLTNELEALIRNYLQRD